MNKIFLILISSTVLLTSCGVDTSKEVAENESDSDSIAITNNQEADDLYDTEDTIKDTEVETPEEPSEPKSVMLGTWIGEMSNKKLTVVIEKIIGDEIFGYNKLGENKRELKGTFTHGSWDQPCTKAYKATLSEPGDDKWDGVFTIKFVGYEDEGESEDGLECLGNLKGYEGMGDWKSNNGKLERDFTLLRKE